MRYYRERLSAVQQYLYDLYAPMEEGYRPEVPEQVGDGLRDLLERCEELDRAWAKSDRKRAVGGEIELRAEARG